MKKIIINYDGFDEFKNLVNLSNTNYIQLIEKDSLIELKCENEDVVEYLSKELSEILLTLSVKHYFRLKNIEKEDLEELMAICTDNLLSMSFYYGTLLKMDLITYFKNNDVLTLESYINFSIPMGLKDKIDDLYEKALISLKNEKRKKEQEKRYNNILNNALRNLGYTIKDFNTLHLRCSGDTVIFKGEKTKEYDVKLIEKDFGLSIRTLEEYADDLLEKQVLYSISLIKLFSSDTIHVKDIDLKNRLIKILGDVIEIK